MNGTNAFSFRLDSETAFCRRESAERVKFFAKIELDPRKAERLEEYYFDIGGKELTPEPFGDHEFYCVTDSTSCTGAPCSANNTQQAWPVYNSTGFLPQTILLDTGGRVADVESGWGGAVGNTVEDRLRASMELMVGTVNSCLH